LERTEVAGTPGTGVESPGGGGGVRSGGTCVRFEIMAVVVDVMAQVPEAGIGGSDAFRSEDFPPPE